MLLSWPIMSRNNEANLVMKFRNCLITKRLAFLKIVIIKAAVFVLKQKQLFFVAKYKQQFVVSK